MFKILHALEDRIDWVTREFGAKTFYLIRHPIPVALSREVTPRLGAFLESHFAEHLTDEQRRIARDIAAGGDDLERKVVDWCLQNVVALNNDAARQGLITYEQIVLDPGPVLSKIQREAGLPDEDRLRDQLRRPSRSVSQSDAETAKVLRSEKRDPHWLVTKWTSKLPSEKCRELMDIVTALGPKDIYTPTSHLPLDEVMIRDAQGETVG